MKIRDGFVSNSSSSSFIVRKDSFTDEELEKVRKVLTTLGRLDKYDGGYEEVDGYLVLSISYHVDEDAVLGIAKLFGIDLVEGYPGES